MVFYCPECNEVSHTTGNCKSIDGVYIRTRYCKKCKKNLKLVKCQRMIITVILT